MILKKTSINLCLAKFTQDPDSIRATIPRISWEIFRKGEKMKSGVLRPHHHISATLYHDEVYLHYDAMANDLFNCFDAVGGLAVFLDNAGLSEKWLRYYLPAESEALNDTSLSSDTISLLSKYNMSVEFWYYTSDSE